MEYLKFGVAVTLVLVFWHFAVQVYQPAANFVRI